MMSHYASLRDACLRLSEVERRSLHLLLGSTLVIDPIACLPVGCVANILAQLPISAMAQAVRVSRGWAAAILTDGNWQRVLRRRGGRVSWLGRNRHPGQDHASIRALLRHETRLAARWWHSTIPRCLAIPCHGSSTITSLQMDEEHDRIILGSEDQTISVWQASTGQQLSLLQGHAGGVWALSRVFQGDRLVSGGTDRTLLIWSLSEQQVLHRLVGHTSTVRCVEVALKGAVAVSGSRDGTVRVWCTRTGRALSCLQGHSASVRCLAIFRDRWAISGSYDGTLRVWDLKGGSTEAQHVLIGHGNAKIFSVSCSEDYAFSGDAEGALLVWDPLAGTLVDRKPHSRSLLGHVVVKSDILLAGSIDGWLRAWPTAPLEDAENQILEIKERLPLFSVQLSPAIVSLDYNQRVVAAATEHGVSLLQMPTGKLMHESILPEEADIVWRVSLSSHLVAIAYSQRGASYLAIFNYGHDCI